MRRGGFCVSGRRLFSKCESNYPKPKSRAKTDKIFKLKQVRFQTKTKAVAGGGAAARDAPHCCRDKWSRFWIQRSRCWSHHRCWSRCSHPCHCLTSWRCWIRCWWRWIWICCCCCVAGAPCSWILVTLLLLQYHLYSSRTSL